MRKQRKYLRARCRSTKGILRRYSSSLPTLPLCFPFQSSLASSALGEFFWQPPQVVPWHGFNSFAAFPIFDIPGQIVGIINSDCRFRVWFVRLRDDVCCCRLFGEVLYLFSGWRFNEIESVSNYILWWLFSLNSHLFTAPNVKEIFIRSFFVLLRSVDEGIKEEAGDT